MRSQRIDRSDLHAFRASPVFDGSAVALLMVLSIGASALYLYVQAVAAVQAEIREGILRSVSTLAATVDGDAHRQIEKVEDPFDPYYLAFVAPLERARLAAGHVPYLYTNVLRDGQVYFVANPSPQLDLDGDGFPDSAPHLMALYEEPSHSLLQALREQRAIVDEVPYTDRWGTFISAYAPIFDSRGDFVGTLGMDLSYAGFEARLRPTQHAFRTAAITGVVMAVLVGVAVWYHRRLLTQLGSSRADAVERFARANAFVAQVNRYRADLLAWLVASLRASPEPDRPALLDALAQLSEHEDRADIGPKQDFALDALLAAALADAACDGDCRIDIDSELPSQLGSDAALLRSGLAHLLRHPGIRLRRLHAAVSGETLHTLRIVLHLFGEGEPNALASSLQALESPATSAPCSDPLELWATLGWTMLQRLGASQEEATGSLFAFSLELDKPQEEEPPAVTNA